MKEDILFLAKCLHDIIGEIIANDDKTNQNLIIIQNHIQNFIKAKE